MKTYEDYFARWRTLRAQEAQLGCQRSELEEEIVKQFSPYHKGKKIIVERGDSAFLALFQHRIIHSGDGTILKVENFLIERLTQLLREVEREIEEL